MRCTSVALLVVLVPSLANAGSALDKPAFTATPAELLAEAKKPPPSDTGAVVLRSDDDVAFDDKGLGVHRTHLVVRIDSKDGAESWASIWRDFRPWQQAVPAIRARVISPSGQVTELETSRIVEEPERTGEARQVSARLPELAVGSIVEEEIVLTDRAPFLGGRSFVSGLGEADPVVTARITISGPASLKLHVFERGLPKAVKPRHTVAKGRETWSYAADNVATLTYEPKIPEDTFAAPVVGVSSAASWADAARAYAAVEALKVAQPPELPHGDTLEVARAVTAWLHQHVRYDGADLLGAPYDGVQLDAVVKRGSGNTNELAMLLVALLRGAGVSADIVLVDRAPGAAFDVDRVWLGRFDHALVRAKIGGADVWIDPEDRDLPVGAVDSDDQDRHALSIADAALIRTPAPSAAANTVREVRTYQLAEIGDAHVTEVTREGGTFEASQRRWFRDGSAAEIHKQLAGYVKSAYGGALDTYTTTSTEDLAHPFELTLNVNDSPRADTQWSKIDVYLYAWDTLARLDSVLGSDSDTPRKYDLVITQPHIYEIENRLVVPEGFTVPAPQPDHTRNAGPLTIVEHQRVDGRTLIVTFRLDAGRTRMTPAEVAEVRRAIKDMRTDATHIVIDHTGWALMTAGEFKKGLAELQRLIALQPRDPLHHCRLGQALLMLDDGDGARREARKAVELEPKNAYAQAVLGWVLTHDLLGRQWARGFDRAGARAAYTKALALDPKHAGAAVELAEVLERDDRGRKLEPGADLKAAADAWRAGVELDPTDDHRRSLVRALLWSGDAKGALVAARQLPASRERDAMVIASIAISDGVDAALREADRGDRTTSLQAGGALLMMLRQYDLSRKLLAQAGGAAALNMPQELFERLRREDTPFRPTAEPKDVVTELLLELVDPERPFAVEWDKQVVDDMHKEAAFTPPHNELLTVPVLTDITRAMTNIKVDGDSDAWRAEARLPNGSTVVYLASDGKYPKVIGVPHRLKGVGQHVLRLAGKHDDAAARLLDWVVKDVHNPELNVVWGPGLPRDTKAIQLAGAVLAEDPARSLEIATKCLVTTQQAQLACDLLVADAYTAQKRWAELETFVEQTWAPRAPKTSELPAHTRAIALMHLARWDDARQVLDEALAKNADDRRGMDLRAMLAVHEGERDAIQRLEALAQQPGIRGVELNNIAWLKVVANLDIPDVQALAKKATELEPKEGYILNTLAGVEEETGDLKAAVADLRKSVGMRSDAVPASGDWYIVGRVLEQVGLRDDAIAAYRRVTKQNDELFTRTTYQLANERLKALGAKK